MEGRREDLAERVALEVRVEVGDGVAGGEVRLHLIPSRLRLRPLKV
jgi:hypothetical protein